MISNHFDGEGEDDNSDIHSATDGEVSKFSFYDRLTHYMDRMSITQNNRMAVELAVMVEAGSTMREMGTMKKDAKEKSFYESYMDLIMEMPDEYFDDSSVRKSMLERFKGARNGTMTAESLYRKYETELTALRKFACTVTGIGNLHKLPSGTTQLKQVKGPLIAKMWSEKFPDRQDVNYNDQGSVNSKIPPMFWLEDSKCKYILSCFVHKDNKDISTKPTTLPPGQSRKQQREMAKNSIEKERSVDRLHREIEVVLPNGKIVMEKFGDVEHQIKKARVDGMRSLIDKNKVDALVSQMNMLQQMKDVYVGMMGQEKYQAKLVHLMNQMPGMDEESPEEPGDLFTPRPSE